MMGGCGVGKKAVVGKKGGAWAPAPCPSRPTVLATPLSSYPRYSHHSVVILLLVSRISLPSVPPVQRL
jgi:hypothetical protein